MAYAGILQQSATFSRKFVVGVVASIDAAVLALVSFLGPIEGALGTAALATMLCCCFSPVGLVLLLTLISPIYSVPGIADYTVHTIKWIATIIVLAFTVLRLTVADNSESIKLGSLQGCFIMVIGWGATCSLFAAHPLDGLMELLRLSVFLLVYEIAVVTIHTRRHVTLISASVLIGVAAASLFSFAGLWFDGFQRVRGFFGNPNAFGQYLAFTLPFLAMGLIIHRRFIARLMLGAGIVLGVPALLFSWSRAAILCVAVQVVVYLIVEKRLRILISLFGLALMVAALIAMSTETRTTLSTLLRLKGGTTHRTVLWETGLKAFQEHPVFGLGLGVQKTDVAAKVMWNDLANSQLFSGMDTPYSPHNVYIYMLMTTGLPGLFLLLLLYLTMIRDQWRSRLITSVASQRKLHSIMISVLVGTLAHGFFETGSIFNYGSMANYFWIALGMVEAIKRRNLLTE